MDDFITNLNRISKEDAISITTSLLYSLRGMSQYSTLSELSYILDYDNFMRFIKYYEGMTIKIPTINEINELLKILLLYQYYEVEGKSWSEALVKAGIPPEESISAKMKLQGLRKVLEEQGAGGRKYV